MLVLVHASIKICYFFSDFFFFLQTSAVEDELTFGFWCLKISVIHLNENLDLILVSL